MQELLFDIEATNRCNADCSFCPRDATPHQGLMTPEVFEQSLRRAVEMDHICDDLDLMTSGVQTINLCGLGEPLLNKHVPDWVRRIKEEGYTAHIASNGALLGGKKGDALLEAGLDEVKINACETGEAYEDIYKLPWDKTLDAVTEFAAKAADACTVTVVLVDHRDDPAHLFRAKQFWRDHGVESFAHFRMGNRGGALELDHMDFEAYPELDEAFALLEASGRPHLCAVPFFDNFIGYDGNFYLCCQDWRKQVPVGNVFDSSWAEITRARLVAAQSREPVCRTCAVDPANRIVRTLRDQPEDPDVREKVADLARNQDIMSSVALNNAEKLAPGSTDDLPPSYRPGPGRKRIPVRAL